MLATPDNEEWKYMRKMTNPAFSPENIRKVGTQAHYASAMHPQQANLPQTKATEGLRLLASHGSRCELSDLARTDTCHVK